MLKRFLNAKIRGVALTATHLDYEGSITIDEDYLDHSGIMPNEEVDVLNGANGARFRTYVILGERGSGAIELNGPAARLGQPGDELMILSYCLLSPEEIAQHTPKIVCVDEMKKRGELP